MPELPRDSGPETNPPQRKGIGFGIFLWVAGVTLLAQQAGWVPAKPDWLFPAILIGKARARSIGG